MPFGRSTAALFTALTALSLGCIGSRVEGGAPTPSSNAAAEPAGSIGPGALAAAAALTDEEGDRCQVRVRAVEAQPALPGAPAFEANRIAILGRARGEPMVFGRAPRAVDPASLSPELRRSYDMFAKERPGGRVVSLVRRHRLDKPGLRTLLLREGYAFAEEPADALSLAADVKLVDLFDEPALFLQRGERTTKLTRIEEKRDTRYVFDDGPLAGSTADLLFGDRVALTKDELAAPLHRDFVTLADTLGFDRAAIVRTTETAILADLRFGERTVRTVLDSDGASMRLGCIADNAAARAAVEAFRTEQAPRLRAMAELHGSVTALVLQAMRFDRPLNEKGHDKDGQMRPVWMSAYLQGRASYQFEGAGYPVFDAQGRAWPPEVCVDFVLDSFERASGTWFRPKGETLGRAIGRFTWVDDMRELRGVMGFGERASKHPELFEVRRFQGRERIEFGERARFFQFLQDHAEEIHAGDVVAIHGLKRDERIHQHAILIERTDPLTGFAYGLADQMRRPRRRTWEGIMAEAPKRSLLFRVRPKEAIFESIDPGEPVAAR
jgi:hypothetical protein